jgi:2-polyprenyl-3-methyl-5-hydroxy-6-metoxy-1,4-benzoquinol methylase
MADMVARQGFRVVGVDASESGLALARKNFPQVEFVQAQLGSELGDIIGQDFDLVISSDVIEHLYCPGNLLEAAQAILKPGGQALIGTPYHGYVKNLVLALTGKMDDHFTALWDGGHIKFFSVRTLGNLLEQHGFEVFDWSYFGRVQWLWKNMVAHARKPG